MTRRQGLFHISMILEEAVEVSASPLPIAGSGRRLSPAVGFALAGGIIGLCLFASATPSPLYADYAARWHFSTLVLTSIYGVYALGVLVSLLLVGRLSDEVGRRPVLLVTLVGLLASSVLFMAASSVGWLFAARGLQGLATGAALGAAGAALLDLHPRGDAVRAGLVNGIASTVGIASGGLISSILVQEVPDPRLVPYLVLAALFVGALVGTMALPEPVTRSARPRLRPQRPHIPAGMGGSFVLASLGVISSWSVGGLYLSLAPSLADQLLRTRNHLAGGAVIFALAGSAAVAQLAFHRLQPRTAMGGGSMLLAAGMAATAGSLSVSSSALFFVASVITGAGFGVAFMGAVRLVSVEAPPEHRGSVMSAFYIVAYLSLSVPALVAGLVAPSLGLESTFRDFAFVVVALALVTAAGTRYRQREPA
jgi:MFS family permease